MDRIEAIRTDVVIENPARPGASRSVSDLLVDTDAELSLVPAEVLESLGIERSAMRLFRRADGTMLERWIGSALISVAGRRTADEIIFGEPGDLVLLGARSLAGLNLTVEPIAKRLVDAGPAPAGLAETSRQSHGPGAHPATPTAPATH